MGVILLSVILYLLGSRAFLDSVVSVDKARKERNKGLLFELHHQWIHYNKYCSAAEMANYSCMTLTLTKLKF